RFSNVCSATLIIEALLGGYYLLCYFRLGYFGFQLFMQISGASSWAKINGPILYICKKKKNY
uniref:Uncharacterized protein n=1 Tax=Aegilops tauschii subsp. strangulata TaxID=200361 RepID=A0A453HE95_AEGTS